MIRFLAWSVVFVVSTPLLNAADLNLLFLGDQNSHQPATRFNILQPVLSAQGIELTYTENVDDLNSATLGKYDGLVLYANIDEISERQARSLLNYVAAGNGFVPLHCATYCFRNDPRIVALMGAQFQRHGAGEMTTRPAGVSHPVVNGYDTFTSWDETYVHHQHNETDRVVLEYRFGDMQAEGNDREPWTWIRSHGEGRVFYTAWGHDQRTWNQAGFHDLVERGIRWACGEGDVGIATTGNAKTASTDSLPTLKPLAKDLPTFEYVDVGMQIPNYPASQKWGVQEQPLSMMQRPASSKDSMQHIATPEGFHVELFADEAMLGGKMFGGKPIAMNWDARGRLWVCETVDYPNELNETGRGRDRIRVIEDTDGDNVADTSTVFADGLSIPTAIAFHRGGIVVQNGTETLYMKDVDGDGRSDVRKVLMSNWTLIDTHGGVGNFRNGLDNWIWAMQGYNDSAPVIDGVAQPKFRMGFFRFKLSQDDDPKVENLEFVRSTTNNTWGLGISEEGLIFGSTANRAPSFFMPIANRYYERVKGWAPKTLSKICPDHYFDPISDKVRQVDHHGGYTAAAGHALYTARSYPQSWWNRTAFVCGPTGKLVGTFVIERDGAGMKSQSPTNLFASDDEWVAPIMAEVGPDGNVWVLDWYNYIVQHNPTPKGFKTGKGRAYESDLRDKKYGRVYRVVPDAPMASSQAFSKQLSVQELIAGLASSTMQVRLHAQRLLIERGKLDVVPALLKLLVTENVDAVGLDVAAIHSLNTLAGLNAIDANGGDVYDAVVAALKHPSAGVRLNAVRVLPATSETLRALESAETLGDADQQVVLASLLKISDADVADGGVLLSRTIKNAVTMGDPWLADAVTSAGAMHAESFLAATLADAQVLPESAMPVLSRISEHYARARPDSDSLVTMLSAMDGGDAATSEAIITGLARGWPRDFVVSLGEASDDVLLRVFNGVSDSSKSSLARLAVSWSTRSLQDAITPIVEGMIARVRDDAALVSERLAAAEQLMQLDSARASTADVIQSMISPLSPIDLSVGLLGILSRSRADGLADRFAAINESATPEIREELVRVMLSREELIAGLVKALDTGAFDVNDLTIEQRGVLSSNSSSEIRRSVNRILRRGGVTVSSDRSKLVDQKMSLTLKTGNPANGKALFTKNCAACHVFKGEGQIVGPNLNGMSVHPKAELLTHILDPNRSVEANYRLYSVLTADGVVINGLLSGESLTSIEMVDTQGKRHTVLREDIEELQASKKSAMPEGFEQSIDDAGLVDLLEYLTQAEKYVPLGLEAVANVDTTKGMFYNRDGSAERLRLSSWGTQTVGDVPFALIDPATQVNAIMLHGPIGPFAPKLAKSFGVRCKTAAKTIHILGGVAGWAAQGPGDRGVSMIVRLRYADGETEDHPLVDGQHIADYIGPFDVPKSTRAFETLDGGQLRVITLTPRRHAAIELIELVKPNHQSAPVVMAITVEPGQTGSH